MRFDNDGLCPPPYAAVVVVVVEEEEEEEEVGMRSSVVATRE